MAIIEIKDLLVKIDNLNIEKFRLDKDNREKRREYIKSSEEFKLYKQAIFELVNKYEKVLFSRALENIISINQEIEDKLDNIVKISGNVQDKIKLLIKII